MILDVSLSTRLEDSKNALTRPPSKQAHRYKPDYLEQLPPAQQLLPLVLIPSNG